VGFRETIQQLLGISAYQLPSESQTSLYANLEDASVKEIREALGGNLQSQPTTRLRWYLADLEAAQISADSGNLRPAAQLWRTMKLDGVIAGLVGTRSGGLVRLPTNFYGDPDIVKDLDKKEGGRSVFHEMCPPAELEALSADGNIGLGVGVAELVPVPGRKYPVLVRLDPEFLIYRWSLNRWFYQSIAGLIPITPGDGRWVLHIPGARMSPWIQSLWRPLGRAYINKDHAMLHRSNYSRTLANPARVAQAPQGATEAQRVGFFRKLMAWATNTVLEMPPGWEAKLLESNGRGWDVFQEEITTCDNEIMVAIAGQVVTTTGGTGFANADIHATIREDLIKRDGEALAYTLNTQVLPQYIAAKHGAAAVTSRATIVEWDTSTPKELKDQAQTVKELADGMTMLQALLSGSNRSLNIDEMCTRFNVPLIKETSSIGELADAPAAAPAKPAMRAA
jgi:molybdopterin biosynthesis enzyme MoaB